MSPVTPAPRLPAWLADEAAREALETACATELGTSRAEAPAVIAPLVSEELKREIPRPALAIGRRLENPVGPSELLGMFSRSLTTATLTSPSILWPQTLHLLAARTREDLLADM